MDQPFARRTSGVCYNYKSMATSSSEPVLTSPSPVKNTVSRVPEPSYKSASAIDIADSGGGFNVADEYDYCLIFPAVRRYFTPAAEKVVASLRELGFALRVYHGIEHSHAIIVLLHFPLDKLRTIAEKDECSLMLDPKVAKKALKEGDPAHGIKPCYIAHRPDVTTLTPFQYIYAPYRRKLEHLYMKYPVAVSKVNNDVEQSAEDVQLRTAAHPFTELVRLKTIAMMLYALPADDSVAPGLNMRQLLTDGVVSACYPLHNNRAIALLDKGLSQFPRASLPLNELKEYLGEKIGVYFAFAEHLATWLVCPALLGIPLQLFVALQQSLSGTHYPCDVYNVLSGCTACLLMILLCVLCSSPPVLVCWRLRNYSNTCSTAFGTQVVWWCTCPLVTPSWLLSAEPCLAVFSYVVALWAVFMLEVR
jgi:hypothetical protein